MIRIYVHIEILSSADSLYVDPYNIDFALCLKIVGLEVNFHQCPSSQKVIPLISYIKPTTKTSLVFSGYNFLSGAITVTPKILANCFANPFGSFPVSQDNNITT